MAKTMMNQKNVSVHIKWIGGENYINALKGKHKEREYKKRSGNNPYYDTVILDGAVTIKRL